MKKFLALLLSIVMLLPAAVVPTAAAASYPSDVSSGRYIEFKAQESINVYKDKACKTRGTSSPAKAYSASIAKNDVCYIYKIDSSYIQVNYPTSSGRRTGYIKRSALFDKTVTEEYIDRAKASVPVYKANGSNSSIARDDEVWRVDPKVGYSGYRAVIYEAKSGKRAYKMGYITLDDLEKIRNGVPEDKTTEKEVFYKAGSKESAVKARLSAIARGDYKLNKNTVLAVGKKFVGTRADEQCKGYARNLFILCFGINVSSTKGNDYQLFSTTGVTELGSVWDITETEIAALFSQARPGDFVQMKRRETKKPHSAIVYSVSGDGVTFMEANTDGNNTITKTYHTWADLCEKNKAMSLYTATNYTLK